MGDAVRRERPVPRTDRRGPRRRAADDAGHLRREPREGVEVGVRDGLGRRPPHLGDPVEVRDRAAERARDHARQEDQLRAEGAAREERDEGDLPEIDTVTEPRRRGEHFGPPAGP